MVNVQTLQGHWNELRGEIRKQWAQLTDDELEHFEGDLDGLVGLIQRRTGETRDKIENQLEELVDQGSSAVSRDSVHRPGRSRLGVRFGGRLRLANRRLAAIRLRHHAQDRAASSGRIAGRCLQHGSAPGRRRGTRRPRPVTPPEGSRKLP